MKINCKLIALDLDDTLLCSDAKVSAFTKQTIEKCVEAGIVVVLASGRPTFGIEPVAQQLNLKDNYFVAYNGAKIMHNNKEMFSVDLSSDDVKIIYDISKKYDTSMVLYTDSTIITSKINKYTIIEGELSAVPIVLEEDITKIDTNGHPKTMLVDEPELLQRISKEIDSSITDSMFMTFSKPFFLEFLNKNANKGSSLIKLAQMLNIKQEEVVAFGDSYNDISMLEVAGTSVAMGNSVDEVKALCDYVTDTNDNDGVAKFILENII